MDEKYIDEQRKLASKQFDLRVHRLKNLYALNANGMVDSIIAKEIELVKDAGNRISLFEKNHTDLQKTLPTYETDKLIKSAINNQIVDEIKENNERNWKAILTATQQKLANTNLSAEAQETLYKEFLDVVGILRSKATIIFDDYEGEGL